MQPKVSVCIPTYNGEAFLEECLKSIFSQTLRDIEIVIVDDCSKDQTAQIAQHYEKLDKRIKFYRNSVNSGLINNFNRCISLAQGEWISFLAQDDLMDSSSFLENMYAQTDDTAAIVCCRRKYTFGPEVDKETRSWFENTLKQFGDIYPGKTKINAAEVCNAMLDLFPINIFGEPSAWLLKRNVIHEYGMFNKNLIQLSDAEFALRIASNRGLIFVNDSPVTVHYHAKSASSQNSSHRRYRMEILDSLVFLHEMNFNSLYEHIREIASLCSPKIDLLNRFSYKVREAKRKAAGDRACYEEFKKIEDLFPAVRLCAPKIRVFSTAVNKVLGKLNFAER